MQSTGEKMPPGRPGMCRRRFVTVSVVLLMAALVVGHPQAQPSMGTSPADAAMMRAMQQMQNSTGGMSMTGDTDTDFANMMLPHHQAAIDMAQAELRYGHDPRMRRLARDVIAAQQREIKQMRTWLAAHRSR